MKLRALPNHMGLAIGGRWFPVDAEGYLDVPEEHVRTARTFGYTTEPPAAPPPSRPDRTQAAPPEHSERAAVSRKRSNG